MKNYFNNIISKLDQLETLIDQKFLTSNPELWRRGYAKIFRKCFEALFISFSFFLVAILLTLVSDSEAFQKQAFQTLLLFSFLMPIAFLLGLFYLTFGGESSIFIREFRNIENTNFSYNYKKEKRVLWINLFLVALAHIYPYFIYLFISFLSNNEKNILEVKYVGSELKTIILFEFHHLTDHENLNFTAAKKIIEDSICSGLSNKIRNDLHSDYLKMIIKEYKTKDTNNVHKAFEKMLKEHEKKIYAKPTYLYLRNFLNSAYSDSANFSDNLFKTLFILYISFIYNWLKKLYFRDLQARRLKVTKNIIWTRLSMLKKLLYRLILVLLLIVFVGPIIYAILVSGNHYIEPFPSWINNFYKSLYSTLPYLFLNSVVVGKFSFYFLFPVFFISYLILLPNQKRRVYNQRYTPENTEKDREYKRIKSMTDMDLYIEKVQNKERSKSFKTLENFLLIYFPEIWRKDTLHCLRIIFKFIIYFFILFMILALILLYAKKMRLINERFLYQSTGSLYIISFFLVFVLLLAWRAFPIQKEFGQNIQNSRFFSFSFLKERALLLLLISLGFLFITFLKINKQFMFYIVSQGFEKNIKIDDFYTKAVSLNSRTYINDEVYIVIRAEYYFAKTYDNLSDSTIINSLLKTFHVSVDTLFYKIATSKGIKYVMANTNLNDSLNIVSEYHNFFSSAEEKMDTSLYLRAYRKHLSEIKFLIEKRAKSEAQIEIYSGKLIIKIFYLALFAILSLIYFVDITVNKMVVRFRKDSIFNRPTKREQQLVMLISFSFLILCLLFIDLLFLWLILLALISFPHFKYEIYKTNYAPK